jgi:hypothetical protein
MMVMMMMMVVVHVLFLSSAVDATDVFDVVDIPYKNWTTTVSSSAPLRRSPVPELFQVSSNPTTSKTKTETTNSTRTTTTKTSNKSDCYRVQTPNHEIIMRIKQQQSDGNRDDHDLKQQQQQQQYQQLLVVDLPDYVVKNRRELNVDVDYEKGVVVVDGHGYIPKASSTRGLRGERHTSTTSSSSGSSKTIKKKSTQISRSSGRKYCLHQEFVIDPSMLVTPSPSSSSTQVLLPPIWDMTMEMNWDQRKLTLSLPVVVPPNPIPPIPSQMEVEEANNDNDDDQTWRELSGSVVDTVSTTSASVMTTTKQSTSQQHHNILRHSSLSVRSGRQRGGGVRSGVVSVIGTKLCGLARLSRSSRVFRNTPCTTTTTTTTAATSKAKAESPNNDNNTHNSTATTLEDSLSSSPSSSSSLDRYEIWEDEDDHDGVRVVDYEKKHDGRRFDLSLYKRINDRQNALERFLEFSLGSNEEESYWLRHM